MLLYNVRSNVASFSTIDARREGHGAMAPLWLCNKVLKPNFQSIISQTNDGCSLLSLILAKFLLLGIRCENIFALSIVTALNACPFSIKKCAKMSVFCYVKTSKIRRRLRARSPDPLASGGWGLRPQTLVWAPPLLNPGCATVPKP